MEAILQVQRAWLHLEPIFAGSEDIRRQLPAEAGLFEGVNASFVRAMRELHATGNVAQATTRKGLLASFEVRGQQPSVWDPGDCNVPWCLAAHRPCPPTVRHWQPALHPAAAAQLLLMLFTPSP